jgi:hypothetical protein
MQWQIKLGSSKLHTYNTRVFCSLYIYIVTNRVIGLNLFFSMFSGENPWQSFAALFIGILFIYRLRQFFAGGVCTSRARMSGKTVVVTGCNTGIGRETVLDMCRRGARVAMLCRNLEKARGAADYVKREVQGADVVIYK